MLKFVNYKKCTDYLFDLERVGIKYDLNNIKAILKYLGNPERKFKSVHIAGTNGKGSVASIINSVLIESGINTGLYTSPHINDFRERILINGEMISKNYVIDFANRLYKLIEKIKPSFFEVSTAMAFEYFAKNDVDIAVIEAGLGGRLDSTNVLKPVVSVITGIAIDHTEYLGNTIESIAGEKAGIIKKRIPCVTGYMEKKAIEVIKGKCKKENSKMFYADDIWKVSIDKHNEEYMNLKVSRSNYIKNYIELEYPVPGKYQIHNIKTGFTALDIIGKSEGISFREEYIKSGVKNLISNSKFFGRFQKVSEIPKIIIDVSHNVQGIKNIREILKNYKYKNLYIIFGMMKDKEYKKSLEELEKLDAKIILTKPDYKRAEEPEVLYKSVKQKEKFGISENIQSAFKYLKKNTKKDDLILVTGSFFLVSEFVKSQSIHL
jgi:dihydrofolate synthase / folylpolyglutamate synthase